MGAENPLFIAEPALLLGQALGELIERGPERAAANLDLSLLARVATQRRRQEQPRRHAISATRTESTSGRWLAIIDQLSPASRLA